VVAANVLNKKTPSLVMAWGRSECYVNLGF
jgi:hypothetical protein